MSLRTYLSFSLVAFVLLIFGCKDSTSENNGTAKTTTISGVVQDSTGSAVSDATVRDIGQYGKTDISDNTGSFTLQMQTTSNYTATLVILRQGYIPDTISVSNVTPGENRSITITIRRDYNQVVVLPSGTGFISSLELVSPLNGIDISVRGVGATETAMLVFVGKDAAGRNVDSDHGANIDFTISSGLDAELTVTSCPTNSSGEAYTIIRAGKIAGQVQVIATTTVGGVVLQSRVNRISINAGHPDQRHFSMSADRYNFAALDWDGETNEIGVSMADTFSNPVTPTEIYMCSSHGKMVTKGSISDVVGIISQNYISQDPRPTPGDIALGPHGYYTVTLPEGWTRVYAETHGNYGNLVHDSLDILWTGSPIIINVGRSGTDTIYHNSGLSGYEFLVQDQYGHPMPSGTTIKVECEGAKVSTTAPDGPMPDVTFSGLGTTDFTVSLSDDDGGTAPAVPKVSDVIVSVTHPLMSGKIKVRIATVIIE